MRVSADRSRCVGAGNCVMNADTVFDQDDAEGLVVLRDPAPPAALHDAVLRAVQMCPASAISLTEEVQALG